ncbi:MAG: hypothetical protein KatS3mg061_2740 [Dehalococcoidia bacterium]|nr:MAG: hypothetical protein KatS3mg061_2740 [Dehalococcoidia bacterium]
MVDPNSYQHLLIEVSDGVALVRMNRPEKLNAFNAVMGRELLRLPAELREDPAVRVVVLTGGRARVLRWGRYHRTARGRQPVPP